MIKCLSIDNIPNVEARVILCVAVMLFVGFLLTRITKKLKLPNVTGYLTAGVLIGPYVLGILSPSMIEGMGFLTDIVPALIAFGVGKYLKIAKLKKNAKSVLCITMLECLFAAVIVTLAMKYLFSFSWSFSLLLGVIAAATAPTSTIMTIRQYKAKGRFINILLQVIAIDNAFVIIAFSLACVLVQGAAGSASSLSALDIVLPVIYNILLLGLGVLAGFILNRIITPTRTIDHMLSLAIAVIFIIAGVGSWLGISPLLACMVMGMVYVNIGGDKRLFKLVSRFSPPLLLMFFVLSGARLNLPSLLTAGLIGVAYFAIRIIGKLGGAYLGAVISKSPKTTRKYLGLALIPQAGVSIGLAALGQRILPTDAGTLLSTIILSSGLLYEIVGPACAKYAMNKSGVITSTLPVPAIEDDGGILNDARHDEAAGERDDAVTVHEEDLQHMEETVSEDINTTVQ